MLHLLTQQDTHGAQNGERDSEFYCVRDASNGR